MLLSPTFTAEKTLKKRLSRAQNFVSFYSNAKSFENACDSKLNIINESF